MAPNAPLTSWNPGTARSAILDFVRKLAATAEVSASVCTGSFILERAGLLQGKRATTHWAAYDEFRALGGDTELVTSGRWVDEGMW